MPELTDGQNDQLLNAISNCTIFDVAIIGGGVAGLSAGIYASRDNLNTLVLEGTIESSVDAPGGALLLTSNIENYPGYEGAAGEELISTMRAQAETFGAIIKGERVSDLDAKLKTGEKHVITTTEGNTYLARSIIIATGAIARRLGIAGEEELYGRGVSTCATCDGFMFKEKTVAVVGGGDTAVEDALLLTGYAKKVYLIVRGNDLRSSGPEAREIINHPDVTILWNTTVESVTPTANGFSVDHIVTQNRTTKELTNIDVDGLFVAIGSDPATGFLNHSAVLLDSDGYIKTIPGTTRVEGGIPGIFAAGDVADKVFRQAITSAGTAVQAALEVRAYLAAPQIPEPKRVTSRI